MNSILDLNLFTKVDVDFEMRQYRILSALHNIRKRFRKNYIYPYLSQLIEDYRILEEIQENISELNKKFPKKIKSIDLENMKIEHEELFTDGANLDVVKKIIEWAKPHIKSTIDEGIAIFEFVDERMSVHQVGMMPDYSDEGYFFIPDNEKELLCFFKYELSIFTGAREKYRSLKTEFMKKMKLSSVYPSPNALKLDLVKEYKEMPNPATYSFDTELSMPFKQTIFPVAKRKLMRHLHEIN